MSDNNTAKNLRDIISRHFDDEELRTLCNDLGIDYDNLRGSGKANKTRELIGYYERRGRLDELVEAVRRERPNTLPLSDTQRGQDESGTPVLSRQSKETFPAKVIAFSSVAGVCFGINIASGSILLNVVDKQMVGYLWLISSIFSVLLFVAVILIIGSLINRGKGLFSFGVPIWLMKSGIPALTTVGISGIVSGTVASGAAMLYNPGIGASFSNTAYHKTVQDTPTFIAVTATPVPTAKIVIVHGSAEKGFIGAI